MNSSFGAPSRPQSAPSQRRFVDSSPPATRPSTASRSRLDQSGNSSSSFELSKRPSCSPAIRARNPAIRTPHVNCYRNGHPIDGSGIPYSLATNMQQIIAEMGTILSLPFSAKAVYDDKGNKITGLGQFYDKMDVVVSMGERFRYRLYLSPDEFQSMSRICKYCSESYTISENLVPNCLRHPLPYAHRRWMCCRADSRDALGCDRGFHSDPTVEDDVNVLPTKRYIYAVLNGIRVDSAPAVKVDIPSKMDILLETCSRRLNLVRYATQLFTVKGELIENIHQVQHEMTLVVSTGDRFQWATYLSQEELQNMPRLCHRCKTKYTAAKNEPNSCRYHPLSFSQPLGYWICCKSQERDGTTSGCKVGGHFDVRFVTVKKGRITPTKKR